jgi:hypothetical protein
MMLTATANARNPYIVAKTLAAQGLAVFPVRAKQPLTPRGVYSATSDLSALLRFDWRNADGCGLATGEASGVDVLDVDVRPSAQSQVDREFSPSCHDDVGKDGFAALAQMGALPETLAAQTPSNGRHFYFRHVVGARSRKLCADGSVEWFSTGKLVVVPPAPGRAWLNDAPIVEAPDWLRAMVLNDAGSMEGGGIPGPLVSTLDVRGEGSDQVPKPIYLLTLRVMRSAGGQQQRRARRIWNVVAAKRQLRNDALNWGAYRFRELIAEGAINAADACRLLVAACQANGYLAKDGEEAVRLTIMSGLGIKDWPLERAA